MVSYRCHTGSDAKAHASLQVILLHDNTGPATWKGGGGGKVFVVIISICIVPVVCIVL